MFPIAPASTPPPVLNILSSYILGPVPLLPWGQRKSTQFCTILDLGSCFYEAIGELSFTLHSSTAVLN